MGKGLEQLGVSYGGMPCVVAADCVACASETQSVLGAPGFFLVVTCYFEKNARLAYQYVKHHGIIYSFYELKI